MDGRTVPKKMEFFFDFFVVLMMEYFTSLNQFLETASQIMEVMGVGVILLGALLATAAK